MDHGTIFMDQNAILPISDVLENSEWIHETVIRRGCTEMLQKKMVGPSKRYKNKFKIDGLWHCPCPLHVGPRTTMEDTKGHGRVPIKHLENCHVKHRQTDLIDEMFRENGRSVPFVTALRELAKLHIKHNVQLVLGCSRCNKRLETVGKVLPISSGSSVVHNKRKRVHVANKVVQRTITTFFSKKTDNSFKKCLLPPKKRWRYRSL
jgi:hypothetical protein